MKHPFLVWLTLGLSALALLPTVFGFFHMLFNMLGAVHVSHQAVVALIFQLAFSIYLGLVIYGVIRRPRWGHGLCISFSLLLVLAATLAAFDLRADYQYMIFPISRMQWKIAHAQIVIASVLYAYLIAIGSRQFRHYFSPPPIADDAETYEEEAPHNANAPAHDTPARAAVKAPPQPAPPPKPAPVSEQPDAVEMRLDFD
ncbi:hypothetical protein GCM10027285_10300 [Oleiagrimonas citrea]